jgi:hypothetical protein
MYRSILQRVAEVYEPAAEAAFVGYCHLFFSVGVRVEHA